MGNIALFLAAGVVVWFGGVSLTRTLDAVAKKTGLGEAFVGMLLLGGITSLPEVANVLTASSQGMPKLAINNLLGSAAINILLLAVGDALIGRKAVTSVVAQPATLMMCTLCMMVLIIVGLAIAAGDFDLAGIGLWSPIIAGTSVWFFFIASTYGKRAPWVVKGIDADQAGEDESTAASLARLVGYAAIAAAAIFAAGYVLSETGAALAEQTGLGTGYVGFMLVGVATSMPELSTVVTALRIKRYEMAFGQVLGTNFVNLSFILLADAVYRGGSVINELGVFEIVLALLGALLIGVFLVGLLERRDRVIFKMGRDSFAVMVLFAAGATLLYFIR